jgi:FkbM family methyltransferase
MNRHPEFWTYQAQLVSSLPLSLRRCAAAWRLAGGLPAKRLYGAWLFARLAKWMRQISETYRQAPSERYQLVHGAKFKAWVDLGDDRTELVLQELCGFEPTLRQLPLLLADRDVFIDIGANHGTFSLHAASIFDGRGHIVAFEPQAALADLIGRSFAENGASNARVFNQAISDRVGVAELSVESSHSGVVSLRPDQKEPTSQNTDAMIPCTTLDRAVESIDIPSGKWFIKLDVEGHEFSVLKGCKEVIEKFHPVLVCEVNDPAYRRFGNSSSEVVALLQENGYDVFVDLDKFPEALPPEKLETSSHAYNVLVLSSRHHEHVIGKIRNEPSG